MILSTLSLSAVINANQVSDENIARIILCPPTHCRKAQTVAQVTIPTLPSVTKKDAKKKTVTWRSDKPNEQHVGKVNPNGLTTTGKVVQLKK